MKNEPAWFLKKKTIKWYLIFFVLFLLSLDFWNWGSSQPLFLGLPLWMWYLLFLTLLLSVAYYFFSWFFWSDEE